MIPLLSILVFVLSRGFGMNSINIIVSIDLQNSSADEYSYHHGYYIINYIGECFPEIFRILPGYLKVPWQNTNNFKYWNTKFSKNVIPCNHSTRTFLYTCSYNRAAELVWLNDVQLALCYPGSVMFIYHVQYASLNIVSGFIIEFSPRTHLSQLFISKHAFSLSVFT